MLHQLLWYPKEACLFLNTATSSLSLFLPKIRQLEQSIKVKVPGNMTAHLACWSCDFCAITMSLAKKDLSAFTEISRFFQVHFHLLGHGSKRFQIILCNWSKEFNLCQTHFHKLFTCILPCLFCSQNICSNIFVSNNSTWNVEKLYAGFIWTSDILKNITDILSHFLVSLNFWNPCIFMCNITLIF